MSISCMCADPDCQINGCRIIRKGIEKTPYNYSVIGWRCPNCGAGLAPGVPRCSCVPLPESATRVS